MSRNGIEYHGYLHHLDVVDAVAVDATAVVDPETNHRTLLFPSGVVAVVVVDVDGAAVVVMAAIGNCPGGQLVAGAVGKHAVGVVRGPAQLERHLDPQFPQRTKCVGMDHSCRLQRRPRTKMIDEHAVVADAVVDVGPREKGTNWFDGSVCGNHPLGQPMSLHGRTLDPPNQALEE